MKNNILKITDIQQLYICDFMAGRILENDCILCIKYEGHFSSNFMLLEEYTNAYRGLTHFVFTGIISEGFTIERQLSDEQFNELISGKLIKKSNKGNYTEPVRFSKTGRYGNGPEDEDDVYTIKEFIACVKSGGFIDYDGHGHPVKNKKADGSIHVKPSRLIEIPDDATHIVWYNR